jgi:glycosyltransferase involved in cell wall biosynthesis
MNADLSTMARPVTVPASPPRTAVREARVRVLQVGPALDVRGGISTVEQLICDYLPPYASIRQIDTYVEASWFRRAMTFGRAVLSLARALESLEPTVVHIHFSSRGSTLRKMLLAQQALNARCPLILHAHGGRFDQFHHNLPPVLRRMVNRIMQQANLIITLSSQWREFYIRECELSPSQVIVLPNPVRVPTRIVDRTGRSEVKFVHLCKLGPNKGSNDLIKAFIALPPELRARARLTLAGNGEVEGMRRLAAEEPRIEVRSWVDPQERERLLNESDVFALPSYIEGVPMALLEAMASGLPSITTPVGGIPDVFTHGAEGFLVQPGDVPAITASMAQLITDEAFRLNAGRAAHERARQYDVHHYARGLADCYQRIAPVADWRVES